MIFGFKSCNLKQTNSISISSSNDDDDDDALPYIEKSKSSVNS